MVSETPPTLNQPKTKIMTTTKEKSKTSPQTQSTGLIAGFIEWFKCLDANYRWEKERAIERAERQRRQEKAMVAPCPFCGAAMKKYTVTKRTYKGKIAGAEKEWVCGTNTAMRMLHQSGVERGDFCLSNA